MTPRPSTAAPILAVLAIVLPFALYVGGYFWLGDYFDIPKTPTTGASAMTNAVRIYRHHWQADVFAPAAMLESWIRGGDVSTTSPGTSTFLDKVEAIGSFSYSP